MTDPTVIQCIVAAVAAISLILIIGAGCFLGYVLWSWTTDVSDE